jgi:hypothetical protein
MERFEDALSQLKKAEKKLLEIINRKLLDSPIKGPSGRINGLAVIPIKGPSGRTNDLKKSFQQKDLRVGLMTLKSHSNKRTFGS